ncbi:MAG: tyrosine-type recombinase/integrase [Sphingobium sp.]
MALTDTAVRNAKPKAKPYKLGDSGGLFLLVQPSGGKLWRVKYRVDGREKKLGLGTYPEISLAAARAGRDEARKLLKGGMDPGVDKARRKLQARTEAGNTFELIAREFIEKRTAEGWSVSTQAKGEYYLDHLKPMLGRRAVTEITPADVLAVLKDVEKRGKLETARRLLQFSSAVFRFAVATARLDSDPTRDLRGALTAPRPQHYGAIIDPMKVGELLRAIDGYKGHHVTLYALKLAPHLFVRPGELRFAEWPEIDLEAAVWTIPAGRMKMRKPHHVPLSSQVVELFKELRGLSSKHARYIFPSVRSTARAMSENTINASLRRLGYASDEMTAHGFRSTASTLLNESGKWHPDAIERALAHQDSDNVRAAYHRGAHWKERVQMAQWWSDYLDQLRKGADIVPFPEKEAG